MNTSYIFLAPGFEEIEALTVLDVMRRAGMDVKTVSIASEHTVVGAHGIPVKADLLYDKVDFITPEWLRAAKSRPSVRRRPLCSLRSAFSTARKPHAIPASRN